MYNLEVQLAALEEFNRFLESFREEMGDKLIMYSNKFFALRESVPVNISESYISNYLEPNTQVLRNLMDTISERDLPYIRSNIATTIASMESARKGG